MTSKLSVKVLPIAFIAMTVFHPAAYAQTENSCVSGSTLWKWVESRETVIEASAKCGGSLFGETSDDIYPAEGDPKLEVTTVHVLSSPLLYISQTEQSSSLAEAETADKLRAACARYVIAHVHDSSYLVQHDELEIRSKIRLRPSGKGASESAYGYSYDSMTLKDEQKSAIRSRLNKFNSCSAFTELAEDGTLLLSNCDQTGLNYEFNRQMANLNRPSRSTRIMAAITGGIANYIRGGEKPLKFDNDVEARLAASALFASIELMVRGDSSLSDIDPKTIKDMSMTVLRGFITMVIYQTHGFVNGGQSGRHIGTHGPADAALWSLAENLLYAAGVCGDIHCALDVAPAATFAYIADGYAANSKYRLLGMPANAVSEFITGSLIGYAYSSILAQRTNSPLQQKIRGEKLAALLSASSRDMCIDVSDIVSAK